MVERGCLAIASITIGIEPTMVRKMLANGVFEVDFGMDAHLNSLFAQSGCLGALVLTSTLTLPVFTNQSRHPREFG